ncbi:Transcription initiation factor IIF beta subunit [Trinorchestia longiramus]|nr:Transcription initiation factor IIF beta subunit [Trinorchestia longiramus]
MSGHGERDMDVTNASRGIWLVKVPKFIRESWTANSGDSEVGRLKITKHPGQKMPTITFSMNEALTSADQLPREHKFLTHDIKQSLGVFSLPRSATEGSQNADGASAEVTGGQYNVSLEGQVIQKFECQPVMDDNYLKLKLETKRAAATPARQAIAIDRPANVYKPISYHAHKVAQEKQKESEGKKAREDKDKVLEILFAAFEKHQYYNIKDLQKITRQPITYLKEILKEVCDYNIKNPHKNTWELKREYRHYKDNKPSEGANAGSSASGDSD